MQTKKISIAYLFALGLTFLKYLNCTDFVRLFVCLNLTACLLAYNNKSVCKKIVYSFFLKCGQPQNLNLGSLHFFKSGHAAKKCINKNKHQLSIR